MKRSILILMIMLITNLLIIKTARASSTMEWSEFSFMLKPSSIGGVGVFAVHDIAVGTIILKNDFKLRRLKIKDLPAELWQYCVFINEEECLCPERFDRMEIGWYINHSSTPNIVIRIQVSNANQIEEIKDCSFYAIKDINAGDEILIDYSYLEEPDCMKEDYYKK